jgi:hypothetical protein
MNQIANTKKDKYFPISFYDRRYQTEIHISPDLAYNLISRVETRCSEIDPTEGYKVKSQEPT